MTAADLQRAHEQVLLVRGQLRHLSTLNANFARELLAMVRELEEPAQVLKQLADGWTEPHPC